MMRLISKKSPNERLAILLSAFIVLSDENTNPKLVISSLKKYIKESDHRKFKKARKIMEATFKEVEKWKD